jgi:hypothetical protein
VKRTLKSRWFDGLVRQPWCAGEQRGECYCVSAHAHTRSERKQLASSLTLQAVMSELVVRKEMACINRERD